MLKKIKDTLRAFIGESVGLKPKDINRMLLINNMRLLNMSSTKSGVSHNEEMVIVSLTSYGKRVEQVHLTIESIMQQTQKPSRIILWLSRDEFMDKPVPLLLSRMESRGLEIRFCEDYKSYKKLIPTLIMEPEATIITVDDDIIFPPTTIEHLCILHKKYPHDVITMRAHRIRFDSNGEMLPYSQWEHEVGYYYRGHDVMPTGGAGTLYPHGCFHTDTCREDLFMKLAPHADDFWFRAMTSLTHTPVIIVGDFDWNEFVSTDPGDGLYATVNHALNDTQLQQINQHYNSVYNFNNSVTDN